MYMTSVVQGRTLDIEDIQDAPMIPSKDRPVSRFGER